MILDRQLDRAGVCGRGRGLCMHPSGPVSRGGRSRRRHPEAVCRAWAPGPVAFGIDTSNIPKKLTLHPRRICINQ